ncbi:nitrogenase iron protein [Corallococcus sp. H22C18031201]|nr:nitrogenase iron protein [Corallococcus sp. H22C18031201]
MPERTMSKKKAASGPPKTLAFFNNKGGVGKTTLSCNMAALIAGMSGDDVLYVDCDPQCNATQLLLDDEVWTEIFANRKSSSSHTILQPLQYIRAGDSAVDANIPVVRSARFGIDVLPGHPGLSIVEDQFSSSWVDFKTGDNVGAARRTLWLRALVSKLHYRYVVFDMGPSLGPLNRTVLLGTDYFVTPMAADLFSLYALDNIYEWMRLWIRAYSRAVKELKGGASVDGDLESIMLDRPSVEMGFAGYTVQQYVSRTSGTNIRSVRAYDRYKNKIPERVKPLEKWAAEGVESLELGVVPNMFSMVPLAQAAHAPIAALSASDGLRGAQISQNEKYTEQLQVIATALARIIGIKEAV